MSLSCPLKLGKCSWMNRHCSLSTTDLIFLSCEKFALCHRICFVNYGQRNILLNLLINEKYRSILTGTDLDPETYLDFMKLDTPVSLTSLSNITLDHTHSSVCSHAINQASWALSSSHMKISDMYCLLAVHHILGTSIFRLSNGGRMETVCTRT